VTKSLYVPANNNILVQISKILPIIYPVYGVKPSCSLHCVGSILGEKNKWGTKHMKV
jgi:hypothetical protein